MKSDITISYYSLKATLTILLSVLLLVRPAMAGGDLEQRTQSFTISLNGSAADVTPLFGPVREAEWAPGWAPHFLHPPDGSQHEGAVFTTVTANGKERLWLLTAYDVQQGRVEYVVIAPGFTANEIKIRVIPNGDRHCKATITYRHSAIAPEGNGEVNKLDAHWGEQQRVHWETAINDALTQR
jgi:hypothetical protein